jgi:hypothetical protein
VYGASWVLVASQPDVLRQPALATAGRAVQPKRGLRMWTDDYSNLIQILK